MPEEKIQTEEGKIKDALEIVKSAIASSAEPEKTRGAALFLLDSMRSQSRNEALSEPDTESVYFGGESHPGFPAIREEAKTTIELIVEGLKNCSIAGTRND